MGITVPPGQQALLGFGTPTAPSTTQLASIQVNVATTLGLPYSNVFAAVSAPCGGGREVKRRVRSHIAPATMITADRGRPGSGGFSEHIAGMAPGGLRVQVTNDYITILYLLFNANGCSSCTTDLANSVRSE